MQPGGLAGVCPDMKHVAPWLGLVVIVGLLSLSDPAAAGVARSGNWNKVTYQVRGGWKIVESSGKTYLELSKDFEVARAPDLKILLSPLTPGELTRKNATEGALRVTPGKLETFRGVQRFELPAKLDLPRYRSIVLLCEKYAVIFADSPL